MGFALFKVDNRLEDIKLYGGSKIKYKVIKVLYDYLESMETMMIEATKNMASPRPVSTSTPRSLSRA